MSIWVLRIFFLGLSTVGGYMVSQVRPELIDNGFWGALAGFGFGGLLVAIDELVKGLSLRAFSAASAGLMLGTLIALLIDSSGLFKYVEERILWLIRLCIFLGFAYIGMILAMRSNKEDFYLIIPFVRFASQSKSENLLVLDTSAIIDGRIADLIEGNFLEGTIVVPRFVLKELQRVADSNDSIRRARGRRGLETLSRVQRNTRNEVKIHEADFPEETEVDAKLVRLTRALGAKLFTNDYNLGKIAELQSVSYVNIHELARAMCHKQRALAGLAALGHLDVAGQDDGETACHVSDGGERVTRRIGTHLAETAHALDPGGLQRWKHLVAPRFDDGCCRWR